MNYSHDIRCDFQNKHRMLIKKGAFKKQKQTIFSIVIQHLFCDIYLKAHVGSTNGVLQIFSVALYNT